MTFSVKVKSYIFQGETAKDAYLKGCKHLAKVIASKKYKNLSFKIERIEGVSNALEFVLYTNVDISENQKHYCKLCKEMHKAFYINEEYNCSRCNMKSFLQRLKEQANISKSYYKRVIED